jgi:surface carbohydrate biosynthesis protein (TIGR04326 family)
MITSLLLWDSNIPPLQEKNKQLLLWRSYEEYPDQDIYSLIKYVEQHDLELRDRYLAFVYILGEKVYQEKRIVEHLQLRQNLSYWWLTLLAEKCNFSKSKKINDIIRLLALEKWLSNSCIRHIKLVSPNKNLALVINNWCINNKIEFEWHEITERVRQSRTWSDNLMRKLPYSLRAIFWLIYRTWTRWPLQGAGVSLWKNSTSSITFVSYLFNIAPQVLSSGKFESRYWGHLPELLNNNNIQTRWLHIWVKDDVVKNARSARKLIDQFNLTDANNSLHVAIDSFIGLRPILKTLNDWNKTRTLGTTLEPFLAKIARTGFDFWPFLKDDWFDSMVGQTAMTNLLMLNLFEIALGSINSQRTGIYLQENQGWEFGFVSAWFNLGHGRLIGVPHSTVRFWDLRYHFDARTYKESDVLCLPLPDLVAANGPVVRQALYDSGFPENRLVNVEALRYFHLLNKCHKNQHRRNGEQRILLVIADYNKNNTMNQMKILEQSVAASSSLIKIIVKPHPACPVRKEDYPCIKFEITSEPLDTLLAKCDFAYTSNHTGGAVDAYCSGVPVITLLDGASLNLSSLRNFPDVQFIATPKDLDHIILNSSAEDINLCHNHKYFILDSNLTLWSSIINA